MTNPSMDTLQEKAEDRFTLCILIGKRARQLEEGAKCLTKLDSEKPVITAIHEVDEGKVKFKRTKSGIK